ncbi:MAG: hypothetical protein K2M06_02250 [Muribaculaceae bacterium]|nr:hypothetical protein [Muribaculaceae bacterium]
MADNYLENKMDEYRRGALSAPTRRKMTPSGHARGCASFLNFPVGLRVFVLTDEADESTVKAMVNAGCRVAFTGIDKQKGTAIAQNCGAQYHPISADDAGAVARAMEHIRTKWRGEADVIVSFGKAFPSGTSAFRVAIGETREGESDICFDRLPDIQMLLWALLPQSREYIRNHP